MEFSVQGYFRFHELARWINKIYSYSPTLYNLQSNVRTFDFQEGFSLCIVFIIQT